MKKQQIKKIFTLFFLVFLLNLFWEVAHSLLYNWNKLSLKNNIYYYIPKILYSSFGDLFLLFIILSIISLKNKNITWINKPSHFDYFLIISLGILIAIFIELRALIEGRWFYNELMPTIFGIGITPLVQLAVTALLALWLVRK